MVVIMKREAGEQDIAEVETYIKKIGLRPERIRGEGRDVIAVIGVINYIQELIDHLALMPGVEGVQKISKPYKLADKKSGNGSKVVATKNINGQTVEVAFGGNEVIIIAGPCSVESEEQMDKIVAFLKGLGVSVIRAGAFKPRTAPRNFEGLGEEGLKILSAMREKYGVLIATEMLDARHADLFYTHADIVQIGTRNMQNFELLKVVGEMNMPIILKRGMSATIEEWLCAAEYVLDGQKTKAVILCERGIRTFETATRNTLDLNAIPVIKDLSWLPIIVDPSHATGKRDYVPAASYGAVAAGADGLLIEVHNDPLKALIDGAQSVDFSGFSELYKKIKDIAQVMGRRVI